MNIKHTIPILLALSACMGGGSSGGSPTVISFVSKDSGIKGSYDPATYSIDTVRGLVGKRACKTGALAAYSEIAGREERTSFSAQCDGANAYEGTAGFTLDETVNYGRVTGTVDGKLVQIEF